MKISRQIGIITVLQRNEKVTAPYLAEKFEVSVRTINRDIEDICAAGIPVVTIRGQNGGISIMEDFKLDTTVFTNDELTSILTGLKSLESVSGNENMSALITKLADAMPEDDIIIDLASFYKESLSVKIGLLKTAIRDKRHVSFSYYYKKGEAEKQIEPYKIIYKWAAWYAFGWCVEKKDFRLYKMSRLWDLKLLDRVFEPRPIPESALDFGGHIKDDYFITAIYEPGEKYKLVEEYGPECFETLPDGRLYTRWGFTDIDDAVLYFMGFGNRVEVIEPVEIRERLKKMAEEILGKYN